MSDDLSRSQHTAFGLTLSMAIPSDHMDEASLSEDSEDFDMDQTCDDIASSEGSVDVDTDMIAWLAESGIVGAINLPVFLIELPSISQITHYLGFLLPSGQAGGKARLTLRVDSAPLCVWPWSTCKLQGGPNIKEALKPA